MEKIRNNWFIICMAIIAYVYLSLPNNNASLDAYDYACSAKYGVDLFHPHHLLFNGFFHLEYKLLENIIPSIDVLKMMQATNALFALGTLIIAYQALKKVCSSSKSKALIMFCACTFGMLRFATEGETYIIPLFFCLLSSLFFIKVIKDPRATGAKYFSFAFLSGLSFAVACLFHQTALFWGIGLWVGFILGNRRISLLIFSLASLMIPIVYIFVMPRTEDHNLVLDLFRYMTDYYHSDSAEIQFGWRNLIMTPISLFRTIYQVHGNIPTLLQATSGIIPSIIAILLAIIGLGLILFFRVHRHRTRPVWGIIEKSHLIIFALSLIFAFFSHGNAEFMVMLPLCAVFFLQSYFDEDSLICIYPIALSAFMWNVLTAIGPANQLNYYNEESIVAHIHQHPQATYLLREKNSVSNKYFYRYGERPQANLVRADIEKNVEELRQQNIANPSMEIYSDVLSRPNPLSRGALLEKCNVSCKKIREALPINCAMGKYTLDQIEMAHP